MPCTSDDPCETYVGVMYEERHGERKLGEKQMEGVEIEKWREEKREAKRQGEHKFISRTRECMHARTHIHRDTRHTKEVALVCARTHTCCVF